MPVPESVFLSLALHNSELTRESSSDFRRVSNSESPEPRRIVSFYTDTDPDPLFSGVFNDVIEWEELRHISVGWTSGISAVRSLIDIDSFQECVADILLPLLQAEIVHLSQANTVYRKREVAFRVSCGTPSHPHSSWFLMT